MFRRLRDPGASSAQPRPAAEAGWLGEGPRSHCSLRTSAESHRQCDPEAPCPFPSTVPPRGPGSLLGAIHVLVVSFPDASATATCFCPLPPRGHLPRSPTGPFKIYFSKRFVLVVSDGKRRCKGRAESRDPHPLTPPQARDARRSERVSTCDYRLEATLHSDVLGFPCVLLLPRDPPRISPGIRRHASSGSSGLQRFLLFWSMLAVCGMPGRRFMERPLTGVCQTSLAVRPGLRVRAVWAVRAPAAARLSTAV